MPTEMQAPAGAGSWGPIRGPQSFIAGLALIGIAAFAVWAGSNLSQGTLRSMGPAMLPRWLAIGVGLCGLLLVAGAFLKAGDRLRSSDYAPVVTAAVVLAASAALALAISRIDGSPLGVAFYHAFRIVFYGALAVAAGLILTSSRWFLDSGLRGPIFVVAGIFTFGLTIRVYGLVFAGPLAMIIGGFATHEVRIKEILIFAAVMTGFCVVLFRYLLNLPIPILIIPGVYQF